MMPFEEVAKMIFLYFVFLLFSAPVHEASHAIVARLTGGRVIAIYWLSLRPRVVMEYSKKKYTPAIAFITDVAGGLGACMFFLIAYFAIPQLPRIIQWSLLGAAVAEGIIGLAEYFFIGRKK